MEKVKIKYRIVTAKYGGYYIQYKKSGWFSSWEYIINSDNWLPSPFPVSSYYPKRHFKTVNEAENYISDLHKHDLFKTETIKEITI